MSAVEVQATPSLEWLAATANRGHLGVEALGSEWFAKVVEVGEALLVAQRSFPRAGEWERWVQENLCFGTPQAAKYMRIAFHKDSYSALSLPSSFADALEPLRFAKPRGTHRVPRGAPGMEAEIMRLRNEGEAWRSIARRFGIDHHTARMAVDPEYHKRKRAQVAAAQKRQYEARRLLKAEENKRLVSATGGETAKAYALVRQALAALDAAVRDSEGSHVRRYLLDAQAHAYKVEDSLVNAVRASRQRQ